MDAMIVLGLAVWVALPLLWWAWLRGGDVEET